MRKAIDFEEAKRQALGSIASWLPGYAEAAGSENGEEVWVCSPLRNDHEANSFSVNRRSGLWNDFANTADKGDILDLYSRVHGISVGEAARRLLGAPAVERPKSDNPDIPDRERRRYRQRQPRIPPGAQTWHYDDGQGCHFVAIRTDRDAGGKDFKVWGQLPDGDWQAKKPPRPEHGYPLLYRAEILADPTKAVIVVEGEKCADAVRAASHEVLATTWQGGARAKKEEQDFGILAGRRVVLWPDADTPGHEAMQEVRGILAKLQPAPEVYIVETDPAWPKGHDAADLPPSEISQRLLQAVPAPPPAAPEPDTPSVPPQEYADLIDGIQIRPEVIPDSEEEARAKARAKFPLVAPTMGIQPPEWIIRGLIEVGNTFVLFGEPSAGKSLIAVDMACCIATGRPYHGRVIRRPGPVYYVAGEGGRGLQRRIAAWAISHSINPTAETLPVFLSTGPASLCDSSRMREVSDALESWAEVTGPPSLVVLDTWNRNFGPGSENDTQDSTTALAAVDALRSRFPACAVAIVHHSGIASKDRSRGSTVLKGAADFELCATKTDTTIVVSNTKHPKDGAQLPDMALEIRTVGLGLMDEEGEEVTAAYVADGQFPDKQEKPAHQQAPRGNQLTGLNALRKLLAEGRRNLAKDGRGDIEPLIRVEDWRQETGLDRRRFPEAMEGLIQKGLIVVNGDFVALKP